MKRSFIAFVLLAILMLGPVAAAEEVRTTAGGLTLNANLEATEAWPAWPVLTQAQALVGAGQGAELMGSIGFIYCEATQASAEAIVSYYAPDPDMDTPHLLPRIGIPVVVIAGTEDKVVSGLIEKTEPLSDGGKIELIVMDGADHAFRDLYSEDIADALAELVGE